MEHHMYDKNICTRKTSFTGGCPDPPGNTSSRRPLGDGLAPLGKSALFLMLTAGMAAAEVITVDDDGKADFASIQAAVDHASGGDEILVAPGVYTSDHPAHVVDLLGKAITLRSSDGTEVTFIDGEGLRRGIVCFNGEASDTVIEGFTIRNGFSVAYDHDQSGSIDWWEGFGGGMLNRNSSPTIVDSVFKNCMAHDGSGGGIANFESSPTLRTCRFIGNSADGCSGGVHNSGSSSPILSDCLFSDNSADAYGGGMCNWDDCSPSLVNCLFSDNSADEYGGGIFNYLDSNPSLANCQFSGNTSASGGGICNYGDTRPTVSDTILCGNTPDQVYGLWTNLYGNCLAFSCLDENGDGIPEKCGGTTGRILDVPSTSYPTIASAIAVAAAGDVVSVAAGTYELESPLNTQGKPITLRGSVDDEGAPVTIIDGKDKIRVLLCTSGEGADTIFANLVITGGYTTGNGAGMLAIGGGPTLVNCTFTDNRSVGSGGGMSNFASNPTLFECTFKRSCASERGGGMFNEDSNSTLINCTFTGNTSVAGGGGMYNRYSTPLLDRCIFSDNSSIEGPCGSGGVSRIDGYFLWEQSGGGMCNENSNTILTDCIFRDNTAENLGGGMYNYASSPRLDDCTFSDNLAGGYGGYGNGGGMHNDISRPTLNGCTFDGNQAMTGGGMSSLDSSLLVYDCTFTNNIGGVYANSANESFDSSLTYRWGGGMSIIRCDAVVSGCSFRGNSIGSSSWGYGGGIYYNSSSVTVSNCHFEENFAASGGGAMVGVNSEGEIFNQRISRCTFTGNTSDFLGGGVYFKRGTPNISRCTFTGNTSGESGGGIHINECVPVLYGTTVCGNVPDQIDGDWLNDGNNLVATSCECPFDFNGDGVVDGHELVYVLGAWGTDDRRADFNGDGVVNVSDLDFILNRLGPC